MFADILNICGSSILVIPNHHLLHIMSNVMINGVMHGCDDKWGDAWLNLDSHLLEDIVPGKKEDLEDKYDNMGHLALETHESLASYVPNQSHEIENHACVVDPGVTKQESWVIVNGLGGNHYFSPELGILGHPLDIKTTL